MRKLLLIFIAFVLHACNSTTVQDLREEPEVKLATNYTLGKAYSDTIPSIAIDSKNTFSLKFLTADTTLKKLLIYEKGILKDSLLINRAVRTLPIEVYFNDWDFDGHLDITVLDTCTSVGCMYWVFNFKPKKRNFEYNKTLSHALGLEIDTISKHPFLHQIKGPHEESWDTLAFISDGVTLLGGCYQIRQYDTNEQKLWVKNYYYKVSKHEVIYKQDSFVVKSEAEIRH